MPTSPNPSPPTPPHSSPGDPPSPGARAPATPALEHPIPPEARSDRRLGGASASGERGLLNVFAGVEGRRFLVKKPFFF
ncbi:hypothetical protein TIFTF001_036265 [Ficus carica]|uniref:Uncharacterized protein n=1 Tax=Ficus carica TaxID=3494 RepID=A0AA88E7A0_FICCA|nr:hypothetical protein TIFTF001_036265 [Ficus carica]